MCSLGTSAFILLISLCISARAETVANSTYWQVSLSRTDLLCADTRECERSCERRVDVVWSLVFALAKETHYGRVRSTTPDSAVMATAAVFPVLFGSGNSYSKTIEYLAEMLVMCQMKELLELYRPLGKMYDQYMAAPSTRSWTGAVPKDCIKRSNDAISHVRPSSSYSSDIIATARTVGCRDVSSAVTALRFRSFVELFGTTDEELLERLALIRRLCELSEAAAVHATLADAYQHFRVVVH